MWKTLGTIKKARSKEEEKEEFDTLYTLLSRLAEQGKQATQTSSEEKIRNELVEVQPDELHVIQEDPWLEDKKEETPTCQEDEEENENENENDENENEDDEEEEKKNENENEEDETNEIYKQMIMPKSMKKKKRGKGIRNRKKGIFQCKICLKSFPLESRYVGHFDKSDVCKKMVLSANQEKFPILNRPIHMLVHDWLEKVITGEKNLQCRYCNVTFINKGNHHKHFYTAFACNLAAYHEFKKLVESK